MKKDAVIVIPIYKTSLDVREKKSLDQVFRVLGQRKIVAAVPEGLENFTDLQAEYPGLGAEPFPASFFDGISAYNRLVLSPCFYRRFENYDYMLIYQLDAYVFEDALDRWTGSGYDYVGAPWIPLKNKYFSLAGKVVLSLNRMFRHNDGVRPHNTFLYGVGNGGFSLRKIETFISLTEKYGERISRQTSDGVPFYPEDLWLFYETAPGELRKPSWKEALSFAFEQNPRKSYELNGRTLPFGCHAWYHPDYSGFWSEFIK